MKAGAIETPEGITLEEHDGDTVGSFDGFVYRTNARKERRFTLTWGWWTRPMGFITLFTALWCLFLVAWYGFVALVNDPPLMMVLLPLIHVAMGIGLAYYVLVRWKNTTRLVVGEEVLSIEHGPLPWRRDLRFAKRHIQQLFVVEYVSHTQNDRPIIAYRVDAQVAGLGTVLLVKGLDSKEKAGYIERLVEEALEIEDRRVAGEVA